MPFSFLVPAFLAGLAALAIPLVLHLRHGERQRPTRFPSLMFLQRIAVQTAERRRITDWPLLLLRALVVILAVLAFARPVIRFATGSTTTGSPRNVVIALDRSLSMGHRATWPRALDSVRAIVASLGANDRVALVLFDDDATIAQPLTDDRTAVLAALGTARPGTRATRYASALRASRQLLDAAGAATGEVRVVSDMQRTGSGGTAGMSLRSGISVHAVPVTPPPANLALANLTAERVPGTGRGSVVIGAQVVSRGVTAPRAVQVTVQADGRDVGTRDVRVSTDGVTPVRFEPIALPPGDVRIVVRMTDDDLAGDNVLHAVVPAEVSHKILLVTPRDARADETWFLERALAIGDDPKFEVVRRSAVDPSVLRESGVVLFYDAAVPVTAAFDDWVRNGGGVIVAAGPRLASSDAAAVVMPATWRGRVDRVDERGASLGDIALEHPIFEPFRTTASSTLGEPRFLRYPRVVPAPNSDVLARFDDGAPALIERRLGDGRVVLLVMPIDARGGDFPLQPAFLPFVRRVALHASGFVATPLSRTTGEGWRPSLAVQNLVVRTPGEALIRPDSQSAVGAVRLDEAGFYAAYRNAATGEPVSVVATNAPARESDLAPMPAAELLLGIAQDSAGAATMATVTPADAERKQRLWRALLVAVVLLLMTETVMASRSWRGAAGRFAPAPSGGGDA